MKLVYLSPVPWSSISQRPHFFVQQVLTQGVSSVLWIEPYPGRLPVWQDLIPSRHIPEPAGVELLSGLRVSGRRMLPVEPLAPLFRLLNGGRVSDLQRQIAEFVADEPALLVIGKPSRLALSLINKPWWRECWFDAMDNYPAFYQGLSRRSMAKLEKLLAAGVDRILCSSHALLEKFAEHANVGLYLNACTGYMEPQPREQQHDGKLCFGYVGTISEWFDWQWIKALASLFPSADIKLVGPLKVLKPRDLPSNVQLLPAIPHHQVPALLATFSAGLIPFVNNDITRYVDPVKYYEYRAAGLPVLSSPFGEMPWHVCSSALYIAERPDRDAVLSLLSMQFVDEKTTWEQRFSGLLGPITTAVSSE